MKKTTNLFGVVAMSAAALGFCGAVQAAAIGGYEAKISAIEISDLSQGGLRFPGSVTGVNEVESKLGNDFVGGVREASLAFLEDFEINAPSKAVFDWRVSDRSSSSLDFAFFGANGGGGQKLFEIFDSGLGQGGQEPVIRSGTFMTPIGAGTYTIGVGVAGDGVGGEDFELEVSNFRVTAVPDAAAAGLLELLALGGLAGFARLLRRGRRAA